MANATRVRIPPPLPINMMPTKQQIDATKDSLQDYGHHLMTRHHHEILPERLWLISRIRKSPDAEERKLYKDRYDLLETIYPNESWKEYIDDLLGHRS